MSLVPALTGVVGSLPLPNTAPTPANGEDVMAEDVQDAVQALLNQDATLEDRKLDLEGGTMEGLLHTLDVVVDAASTLLVSGTLTASGPVNLNGTPIAIGNSSSDVVTVTATTTVAATSTWSDLGIMLEKAPAYLSTADATIDLSVVNVSGQKAQRLQFLASAGVDVELTLRQAAHALTPSDGFWYEFTVLVGTGPGRIFLIREGATPGDYIARIDAGASSVDTATVRVQKVAGVWRGTSGGYLITKGPDW